MKAREKQYLWVGRIPLLLACIFNLHLSSQTREFYLTPPEKTLDSFYSSISLVDARIDTLDYGYVRTGNKKIKMIVATPLQTQLTRLLEKIITSEAGKGEVLLLLRKFKFVERAEIESETGYCFVRASLFSKQNEVYKKLNDTDTLIFLHEADVTDSLIEAGKRTLTNLVVNGIGVSDEGQLEYSRGDILHIDDNEKRTIPAYTNKTFTNGVYLSYFSFKNQVPDYIAESVSFKLNGNARIKARNKAGEIVRLTAKDIYAFVDNEIPYVCVEYGCCVLERKNNNLYYVGKAKVTEDNEEYVVPNTVAESVGPATAAMVSGAGSMGNNAFFLAMIDHVDGSFVRVKKVK